MLWCDEKRETRWKMGGRLDAGETGGNRRGAGRAAAGLGASEQALSLSLGQPASGASSGDTEGPTHPRLFWVFPGLARAEEGEKAGLASGSWVRQSSRLGAFPQFLRH